MVWARTTNDQKLNPKTSITVYSGGEKIEEGDSGRAGEKD